MRFSTLTVLGFAIAAISMAQDTDIPDDADAVRERQRELVKFVPGRRHIYVETRSRFQSEDLERRSRHRFLASLSGRSLDESIFGNRLNFRFERQAEAVISNGGESGFASDALDSSLTRSDSRAMLSERFAAAARDSFINGVSRQDDDEDASDVTGVHRRARMRVRVSDLACYDVEEGEEVVDSDATKRWILNDWEDWDCTRFDEDGNEVRGLPDEVNNVHHVTCTSLYSNDDGCNVTVTLYFSREPHTIGEGDDAVTIDARELKWDINAENCMCPNVTDRLGYGIQTRARAHRIRTGDEILEDSDSDEIVGEDDGEETDGEQPRFRFKRQALRPASCGSAVERPLIVRDSGVDEEDDADDAAETAFARYERNRRFIFLVQEDNSCPSANWDPSIGTLSSEESQPNSFPFIRAAVVAVACLAVIAVGAFIFTKTRK